MPGDRDECAAIAPTQRKREPERHREGAAIDTAPVGITRRQFGGGDAAVVLSLVGTGDDPAAAAKADGLSEVQAKQLKRVHVSSLPAAVLVADTRHGQRLVLTWIAHRPRVFRVAGVTRVRDWGRYGSLLDRTTGTFRPLPLADRDRIFESRLRVRLAGASETIAEVLARGGGTRRFDGSRG